MNCYASYRGRQLFWNEVLDSGILEDPSLILGGDLNLVRASREVWGTHFRLNPLTGWFNQLLLEAKLINTLPTLLMPTWKMEGGKRMD